MPTFGNGAPPEVAVAVLVAVLLIGVLAGRARRRLTLLVAGLVAVVVAGFVLTMVSTPVTADRVAEVTAFYTVALPLLVAFVAGWFCGRAKWLPRLFILAVAAILLAVFPYADAGRATAAALFGVA